MRARSLRVQVPASLGRLLIAPSLPRFVHEHPGLQVQLCDGESMGKMPAHEVDVAICIGPLPNARLIAQQIATLRTATCASPEFIQCHGVPEAPAELLPSSCIALLDPATDRVQEWSFRRGEATHTFSPSAHLVFSDVDSAVTAAVRGGGYVRVLSIAAEQRLASGLLQPVLEDWNDDSQPVVLGHSPGCAASAEISVFAAFVSGLFPLQGAALP